MPGNEMVEAFCSASVSIVCGSQSGQLMDCFLFTYVFSSFTVECILRFLARVAKYFNKWAYVYVGLYGYDYLTAGKKVLELFEARGWTTIINDNLVQRCLVLVALTVGAITGFVGILLARATGWATATVGEDADRIVFLICFVVGMCITNILMGVVLSAVDTVIVSFAEAPTEFETNHPALYQNMVTKWQAVYPDCGL